MRGSLGRDESMAGGAAATGNNRPRADVEGAEFVASKQPFAAGRYAPNPATEDFDSFSSQAT
jgi:hypothetical protein